MVQVGGFRWLRRSTARRRARPAVRVEVADELAYRPCGGREKFGICGRMADPEHFRARWIPVRVKKMR
jgi:hypothetical protein